MLTLLAIKHGIKRLQHPGVSEEFSHYYKTLGIYRTCGKVLRRHGVFNIEQFKKISKQRRVFFDGRQIYLTKGNSPYIKLWTNPFYKK
jgi:hypothetical protein